jgi:hypothetical protein
MTVEQALDERTIFRKFVPKYAKKLELLTFTIWVESNLFGQEFCTIKIGTRIQNAGRTSRPGGGGGGGASGKSLAFGGKHIR